MPYVSRNPEGKIEGIFDRPGPDAQEKVTLDNVELIEFLSHDGLKEYTKHLLEETDRSIIRVVDDLIDALFGSVDRGDTTTFDQQVGNTIQLLAGIDDTSVLNQQRRHRRSL